MVLEGSHSKELRTSPHQREGRAAYVDAQGTGGKVYNQCYAVLVLSITLGSCGDKAHGQMIGAPDT